EDWGSGRQRAGFGSGSSRTPSRRGFAGSIAEELRKPAQTICRDIGDRPPGHPRLRPVDGVEALERSRGETGPAGGRPGEDVDDVPVRVVDERRHRAVVEVVEPAAGERESV